MFGYYMRLEQRGNRLPVLCHRPRLRHRRPVLPGVQWRVWRWHRRLRQRAWTAATFFTFVATHSAFELTAIVLSGAAGACLGQAALLPGRRTPWPAARCRRRRATAPIISGVAVMLLIAAAFEAFWSSAPWIAPSVKFIAAAGCWSVVLYFFLRNPDAR
ncbi:MAG: stage II sporulation protein M [Steroidobacteraceae bacterium]